MIQNGHGYAAQFNPPKEYEPFARVTLCGVRAFNTRYIIEANGFPPILIGKGQVPMLWLAKVTDNPDDPWKWVVDGNQTDSQVFKIKVDTEERTVLVRKRSIPIISAGIASDGSLEVDYIDLRPLGINIYGENDNLHVGEARMDNCAYMNVRSLFEIGPPPAK